MKDTKKWYVIYTKTGEEIRVKKFIDLLIDKNKIKTLIPRRLITERKNKQLKKKMKYLFPGYLFVKTDMCNELYYEILNIPYFLKFLKDDLEPTEVYEDEIRIILNLMGDSELIGYSTGVKVGSKIRIVDGPLKGYEGLIEKINKRKERAKVRLSISGNANFVDLGLHIIENISEEDSSNLSVS